jgi:hypothetical protein
MNELDTVWDWWRYGNLAVKIWGEHKYNNNNNNNNNQKRD